MKLRLRNAWNSLWVWSKLSVNDKVDACRRLVDALIDAEVIEQADREAMIKLLQETVHDVRGSVAEYSIANVFCE